MAGLHRARRAYRHENRGLDGTMVGIQNASTGIAFRIVGYNIKVHHSIFVQKYIIFQCEFIDSRSGNGDRLYFKKRRQKIFPIVNIASRREKQNNLQLHSRRESNN
jgi:hypothetical protein